jgi:hypothetical protein
MPIQRANLLHTTDKRYDFTTRAQTKCCNTVLIVGKCAQRIKIAEHVSALILSKISYSIQDSLNIHVE